MTLDDFARTHSIQPRPCQICRQVFTPPSHAGYLSTGDNHETHCAKCRRVIKDATLHIEPPTEEGLLHAGPGAPMRQVVFDLETWGLDRGWGVTLVACFLIHGAPEGPRHITLTHRESKAWKAGKRSNDSQIAAEIFRILSTCHIAYAHNGDRFDFKWLRSVALKYGLQMPRLKLVDPCQIAWRRYLLGRNSLEAVADFLGMSEEESGQKIHLSPDVWRGALMDDEDEAWQELVRRCSSDVEILNKISARVTGDVNMVDFAGSWR